MVFTPLRRAFIGVFGLFLVIVAVGTTLITTSGGVHANSAVLVQAHTCANQPDSKSCDGQDPYQQGCIADATTVPQESISAYYQGQQIGVAELRYSARCNSFWDRVIAFAGTPIVTVTVLQSQSNGAPQQFYGNSTPQANGSLQVYTDMVYNIRTQPDTAGFEMTQGGMPIATVALP